VPTFKENLTMHRLRLAVLFAGLALASSACAASGGAPTFTYSPPDASVAVATPTAPAATPVVTAAAPMVTLSEWKVVVAGTIKSGKTDLTIKNAGAIQHELLVFKSDLAPSAYPKDAAGDIIEDGPGVTLLSDGENVDPAGTQARTVDLAAGTYLFVCNIPGHFKAGMFTVVTVAP
jgi:uncharacterized cupredoxin-like copper-binding protein